MKKDKPVKRVENASRKVCPECGAEPDRFHSDECQREAKYRHSTGFDVVFDADCCVKVRVTASSKAEAISKVRELIPAYFDHFDDHSRKEFERSIGIIPFEENPGVDIVVLGYHQNRGGNDPSHGDTCSHRR